MEALFNPISISAKFVIPAGGSIPYGFVGTFVRCLDSNGEFRLCIGTDTSGMVMEKGIGYDSPDNVFFETFRLVNETPSDITCVLAFGRGMVSDNRLVVGSGLSIANVMGGVIQPQGGQNGAYGAVSVSPVANQATQILAADANGAGWIIHNNGLDVIYLGTNNAVTAANGLPFNPGEKISWDARAALWGCSATINQDVRFMKAGV